MGSGTEAQAVDGFLSSRSETGASATDGASTSPAPSRPIAGKGGRWKAYRPRFRTVREESD